ncbi:Tim44-like domain [Trinorchestia longiramus]|nr:Tim44-like domain [Trinorchestia longiramus]
MLSSKSIQRLVTATSITRSSTKASLVIPVEQRRSVHTKDVYVKPGTAHSPTLHFKRKHWNPLYKKERGDRVVKVDLDEDPKDLNELTPQEIRMMMKVRGLHPFRPWNERPINLSCTPSIFEPYVPPEFDGKLSIVSKDGAKQKFEVMGKKGKTYLAVKKITAYDEDFDMKVFVDEAQNIYRKAHQAIADEDEELLHDLVTERAFPIVTHETKNKTIRWQFIESVEAPRAVHARASEVISKDNIFAQITVRLHTKQTLAVYDRFGRLMHGSEVIAKDVLEYVVFEKFISNTNGLWRIHDKIIPDWMPKKPASLRTVRLSLEETAKPPEDEEVQNETASAV